MSTVILSALGPILFVASTLLSLVTICIGLPIAQAPRAMEGVRAVASMSATQPFARDLFARAADLVSIEARPVARLSSSQCGLQI